MSCRTSCLCLFFLCRGEGRGRRAAGQRGGAGQPGQSQLTPYASTRLTVASALSAAPALRGPPWPGVHPVSPTSPAKSAGRGSGSCLLGSRPSAPALWCPGPLLWRVWGATPAPGGLSVPEGLAPGFVRFAGPCDLSWNRVGWGGGLHVYFFFFPEIKSLALAASQLLSLMKSGIVVGSWQWALFPEALLRFNSGTV